MFWQFRKLSFNVSSVSITSVFNQTPQRYSKIFYEHVIKHMLYKTTIAVENEIRIFIALLLFNGYHCLPLERLYLCLDEHIHVQLLKTV